MKRLFFFTALLLTIIISACKKKTLLFHTHYDLNVTIPATGGAIPPGTPLNPPVTVNLETPLEFNDSRVDLIEKATLESFNITIAVPPGKTFSWCEEMRLAVSAEDLPETEVAYATAIDPNATSIDFKVTDANIAAYLKMKKYNARIKVVVRESFNDEMKITGRMNFRIEARFK